MIPRTLAVALFAATSLLAQEPAVPATPIAPAAPDLPAAGSPEATALVDKALMKMRAYGRGAFSTVESQDSAMLRGAGLPFGNEDTEVTGGWDRDLQWGEHDGNHFLRANGRMLAKVDGGWRLRGKKLGDGKSAPFTLDADLLFMVLQGLPESARKVVHVDAAEVGGKKVGVLSLQLGDEAATEFAESGAVPGSGGRGFMLLGGPGGMGAPEIEYTAFVALFVDPASGDVLRCSTKVFEKNPMMGNVQIQVAGGGGDGDEDEKDEAEAKEEPAGGAMQWKKGLPVKKPAKDESVTTFRADFKQLGIVEVPALDAAVKAMLRL